MGRWGNETMGKRENEMMRKRDNGEGFKDPRSQVAHSSDVEGDVVEN